MLKVNDDRTTYERRLKDLDDGEFFVWNDLVMRVVGWLGNDWSNEHEDEIAVMVMTTGELMGIDRNAWVEPIPDRQIHLTIED